MIEFLVVQHGEKDGAAANPADPGLTARGRRQAQLTATHLRGARAAQVYSSPFRRARETAEVIAAELGLPVRVEGRLRERMNWGDGPAPQPLEHFLRDWARATQERDFTPAHGDSSRAAGRRFGFLLEELVRGYGRHSDERIVLVAHGGVTIDLLRNLFTDGVIRAVDRDAIERGVPACGITRLIWRDGAYELKELGAVTHLASEVGGI